MTAKSANRRVAVCSTAFHGISAAPIPLSSPSATRHASSRPGVSLGRDHRMCLYVPCIITGAPLPRRASRQSPHSLPYILRKKNIDTE